MKRIIGYLHDVAEKFETLSASMESAARSIDDLGMATRAIAEELEEEEDG